MSIINSFLLYFVSASDFTMYPFSTQNEKDFSNLLSVYLDAVFFPRLTELDFWYVYCLDSCASAVRIARKVFAFDHVVIIDGHLRFRGQLM